MRHRTCGLDYVVVLREKSRRWRLVDCSSGSIEEILTMFVKMLARAGILTLATCGTAVFNPAAAEAPADVPSVTVHYGEIARWWRLRPAEISTTATSRLTKV